MSTFYDALHEIYNKSTSIIPREYFSTASVPEEVNVNFDTILGAYNISSNELHGIKFFTSRKTDEHGVLANTFMSFAKYLRVQDNTGLTTNKDSILKEIISYKSTSVLYLYNSKIIFGTSVYDPCTIQKDELFNLSTSITNNEAFSTFRFFMDIYDKVELDYICVNYLR